MRRTAAVLRGAKGYGWYNHYRTVPQDFNKFTLPTPFDWAAANITRPKAVFEITSAGESWGKLEFELAQDIAPKTVENFTKLVKGQAHNPAFTYKNTKLHQVRKGHVIMGGDVESKEGSLSHSAFATRYFNDENFIIPHSSRGLLSMASIGVHTNGSQFYISLSPTHHLNGRCVVFGRLVSGEDVLARMEKVFAYKGVPATDIVITACDVIESK